ncbi:MAG: DUF1993 domain-containing protein [Steroidobacterales bacterium]
MTVSIYTMSVDTFVPMLRSLSAVLDKGAEHARAKGLDPDSLVNARLAPDMFPLARQVQIACDQAKNGTARLTGQEPPRFEDNEKTLAELKARIAKTLAYLDAMRPAQFEDARNRQVTFTLNEELALDMDGVQYLRDWALPHFYFHVVTAYDILRHNGVEIGKRDYLSHVDYAIHRRN